MLERAKQAVLNRITGWFQPENHDVFKRPGIFKKRKVFACGCSGHDGMCHKRKGGDTARVERRERKKIIEASLE